MVPDFRGRAIVTGSAAGFFCPGREEEGKGDEDERADELKDGLEDRLEDKREGDGLKRSSRISGDTDADGENTPVSLRH